MHLPHKIYSRSTMTDRMTEENIEISVHEETIKQRTLRRDGLPNARLRLEDWTKPSEPVRYLYCDMIKPRKATKKIEEALTLEHVSDNVYYSILYLEMRTFRTETQGPSMIDEKVKALQWLKDFRSQMVKIFVEECKKEYFLQANTEEWKNRLGNRIGFASYRDLEEKLADEEGQMVSDICVIYGFCIIMYKFCNSTT